MPKSKPPHKAAADDPVELSNVADPDTELSQVAALRALADDRARKIELLERERDELVRDLQEVRKLPPKASGAPSHTIELSSRIAIAGIDMLTAPVHALVLRFSGEEHDLVALKAAFEAQLRSLEAGGDSPVDFDGKSLPGDVRAVVESLPA